MQRQARETAGTIALWLCISPGLSACARASIPSTLQEETMATNRASGTFDVTLSPQAASDDSLSRMTLDKRFHGDLDATSKGQMLAAGTAVKGSAGYVAIERVTGTLGGRTGTFMLQHSGTMTRGAPQLTISVVPDSGTDQLVGLAGTMTIIIEKGQHSYHLDYTLPASP